MAINLPSLKQQKQTQTDNRPEGDLTALGDTHADTVSISQAADILGVSIDTVRRWDKSGVLHSTRPDGKNRYFSVSELEAIKFSQPLTISEAAEQLGVSPSTLRRLEKKGVIQPSRDEKGDRVYDRASLEQFLHSGYFMRQKEIEEKILEPLKSKSGSEQNPKTAHDPATHALLGEHHLNIASLKKFRKIILMSCAGLVGTFVLLISVLTILFLLFPENTAKTLGYYKQSPNSKKFVFQSPDSLLARQLRPFSQGALRTLEVVNPVLRARVAPFPAIRDVNDILAPDAEGNITSLYNFTVPDTSYLKIPDKGLVVNLNSDYLRGRVPGEQPGNLALLPIKTHHIADGAITKEKLAAGLKLGGTTTVVTGGNGNSEGDITEIIAGVGLSGGGTSGSTTLNIGVGDGLSGNADSLGLDLQAGSGLQTSNSGLSLNRSCSNNEILKWNGLAWVCAVDDGSGFSLTVGESDGSPTTSDISSIQFGPGSNSSDEFVVTDMGGGVVRITIGSTILTTNNYSSTLDGSYVNSNESPAAGDISGSFAGGLSINPDAIALGTDTTGNYVSTITAANGLSVSGAGSESATATLSLVVQANKGIEADGAGLSLIDCSNDQVLKYSAGQWVCAADLGAGSALNVKESDGSPNVPNVISLEFGDTTDSSDEFVVIDLGGGASRIRLGSTVLTTNNYGTTLDSSYVNTNESPVGGDISGSFASGLTINPNSVTLGTDTVGDYVANITAGLGLTGTASGEGSTPTLNIGAGNGITANADDIALGALVADWNQTGAFDIVLNNSSSELKILENGVTPQFFGIFDVADLTADRTYLFPNASGELTLLGQTISNAELENTTVNFGGVTVALGGSDLTPAFDLSDATGLPIVAGTTGTLTVNRGGTGVTTFTTNGLIYGNGTGALQATSAGTSGQLLVANALGVPTFVTLSGDGTIAASGTFTLANSGVTAGTYGSSSQVPVVTVDAKGRVTSVTNTTISGTTPGGAAGGDLSGTYPNPTVARINGALLGTTTPTSGNILVGDGAQWNSTGLSGDATLSSVGSLTIANNAITTIKILDGAVTNAKLQNSSLTINAGTGLTGGGTVALGGNTTLNLSNVGTAGSYGSASQVPVITTDAQGRVTSVVNTAIAIDAGAITSGTLGVNRGGTGVGSFTANGLLYGNGTGAIQATTAGTSGQLLQANVSGVPVFVTLSGDANIAAGGAITLANSGVAAGSYGSSTAIPVLTIDAKGRITGASTTSVTAADISCVDCVALGTETTGNYVATVATGDGISVSGSGSENAAVTLGLVLNTGSGLETSGAGLSLLRSCGSGQVLKWNGTAWACAADSFAVTFSDSTFKIYDDADNTKQLAFEVSGIATGTTRTLTAPNVDGTLITTGNLADITAVGTVISGVWQGSTVGVQYGGTGTTSFTTNGLIYGNGTGALQTTAAGTAGQLLVANASGVPTFVTMNGDGTLAAAGTFSLANSGVTAGTYGSSTAIPVVTVDAKGRVTNVTTASITASDVSCTDCIALGSETTGNYVATVAGSSEISVTGSGAETAAVSLGIIADSLNFTHLADNLSLDDATTIALGINNFNINLDSTGDFVIQDGGVGFATFSDAGTFTLDNLRLDGNTLDTTSGNLTLDSLGGTTTINDLVGIPTLGSAGSALLCRNGSNELATCVANAGGVTLQQAYDAGNAITTSDNRNIIFNLADSTIDADFIVNQATYGNIFEIDNNAVAASDNDLFRIRSEVGGPNNIKFRVDSDGDVFADGTLTIGGATTTYEDGAIGSTASTFVFNAGGNLDVQDAFNADSITTDVGGVSIAAGQSYTGAGAVTLSSGGSGSLVIDSASGSITFGTDDDLVPTLGAGDATVGTSSARWDGIFGINADFSGTFTASGGISCSDCIALGTETTGDYVASITAGLGLTGSASGEGSTPTLNIGAGNGITANADDIALGALVADWNQTGAFDIVLNNSSSELKILENGVTPQFFGIFDVADLTADRTYLFPNASGELTLLGQTISNAELENTTVNFGGVTVALGGSDLTPAFNLVDATGLPIDAGTTGTLGVARGGTGATSFTTNGLIYGNGTGALQTTAAGTPGQLLLANALGVPTFTTLSGDVASVSGTGAVTLSNSGVVSGSYGSASEVPVLTVDSKGRITGVTNTAISINANQVTSGTLSDARLSSNVALLNGTNAFTGSNSFIDSLFSLSDNADNTKKMSFELSSVSTGTTRTLTVPNASGTIIATGNLSDITATGTVGSGAWQGSTVTVPYGGTGATGFTANGLVYGNGTGALQVTAAGTGGQLVIANASGVPTFATLGGDATLNSSGALTLAASGVGAGTYGSASQVPVMTVDTKGRVTGVTNTAIAIDAAAITSGTLSVARGGTGLSALTANGLVYGNGTGAVGTTSAGTTGQILQANGSGVPTFVTVSGDATIANGGAVTLANTGVTAGTYGSSFTVPVFTVDAKGRITGVSNVNIQTPDDSADFAQLKDVLTLDADLIVNHGLHTWQQNFAGTTSTAVTFNGNNLTSGNLVNLSSTQGSSSNLFTGDVVNMNYSKTYTGATGDESGSLENLLRSVVMNSTSNTLTVSGAVSTISDTASAVAGTLNHTADVLQIQQNYAGNTGAALNVTTAGTGYALRVNDDGTLTDSTPFVVDSAGNVGVGTTTTAGKLDIRQGANGSTILHARRATDTSPTGNFIEFMAADGATTLFSIDVTGAITMSDDAAINGGDLTTTASTFNLINTNATTVNFAGAATGLNIGDSVTTKTIDIGGVDANGADTINIATNGTTADTVNIGNQGGATEVNIDGGTGGINLDATGSVALTAGTTINLNAAGASAGNIVLTDTDTIQIGGVSGLAYNAIANAGGAANGGAVTDDNDLYIQGALEVDGDVRFDGGTFTATSISAGGFNCTGCVDFDDMEDTLNLDAATSILLGAHDLTLQADGVGSYIMDLTGTGDFEIRDSGVRFVNFQDDGTITLGKDSAAGTINIGVGSGADTINIGTGITTADTITIGNTAGATTLNLRVGTGNFTLDGVAAAAYTVGASTTTGTITIGGTAQTGAITLGASSGTNIVNLGTGEGATTVNIATGGTNAKTVNIGTAALANGITIGSTATSATTTVRAGSGGLALNATSGNVDISTLTSGNVNLTTATASGLANVLTGNLKVGNGTPTNTQDGEDAYIEGDLEVDGVWNGNTVISNTSHTTNTTVPLSTKALVYHVTNNCGSNSNATTTITVNITGLPDVDGTVAYVYSRANVTDDSTLNGASTCTLTLTAGPSNDSFGTTTVSSSGAGAQQSIESYAIIRTDGDWKAFGAPGTSNNADLAEWTPTTGEKPQPAEIVSMSSDPIRVEKSKGVYDQKLVGVVSTAPHTVMGPETPDSIQLALAGRVPVKVTTENGAIKQGDYITSSSLSGVGMKATKAGYVVGIAMEDFDGEGTGQVMMFVNTHWYAGDPDAFWGAGLDGAGNQTELSSEEMLAKLKIDNSGVSDQALSNIITDRLVAGIEIVTPKVTTDRLQTNTITSAGTNNIDIELKNGGELAIKDKDGQKVASFDSEGNASFDGTLTAEDVHANQIVGTDIGEQFFTNDTTIANGDVVSLDSSLTKGVRKSGQAYDSYLVGVVSSGPSLLIDQQEAEGRPVVIAVTGVVPVKVNSEGGAIKEGDPLTSSSVAGVAMKASKEGAIIGRALGTFDGAGVGTVLVRISNGYSSGNYKDQIDNLTQRVTELEGQVQGLQNETGTSSSTTDNPTILETLEVGTLTVTVDLNVEGGLTVVGPAEFQGTTVFHKLVSFVDRVVFKKDVQFEGRPIFNEDTAGFAVVEAGEQKIKVEFSEEYAEVPVVTLSLGGGKFASYSYANLTTTGFEIVLEQPATENLQFSWMAIAVDGAKTHVNAQ